MLAPALVQPALCQPLAIRALVDVLEQDPAALALDLAEDAVHVYAHLPVQGAPLSGALDAARGDLLDVDVREVGARFDVLGDCKGDGRHRDDLAHHPADTLLWGGGRSAFLYEKDGVGMEEHHLEDRVEVIGELFVLGGLVSEFHMLFGVRGEEVP